MFVTRKKKRKHDAEAETIIAEDVTGAWTLTLCNSYPVTQIAHPFHGRQKEEEHWCQLPHQVCVRRHLAPYTYTFLSSNEDEDASKRNESAYGQGPGSAAADSLSNATSTPPPSSNSSFFLQRAGATSPPSYLDGVCLCDPKFGFREPDCLRPSHHAGTMILVWGFLAILGSSLFGIMITNCRWLIARRHQFRRNIHARVPLLIILSSMLLTSVCACQFVAMFFACAWDSKNMIAHRIFDAPFFRITRATSGFHAFITPVIMVNKALRLIGKTGYLVSGGRRELTVQELVVIPFSIYIVCDLFLMAMFTIWPSTSHISRDNIFNLGNLSFTVISTAYYYYSHRLLCKFRDQAVRESRFDGPRRRVFDSIITFVQETSVCAATMFIGGSLILLSAQPLTLEQTASFDTSTYALGTLLWGSSKVFAAFVSFNFFTQLFRVRIYMSEGRAARQLENKQRAQRAGKQPFVNRDHSRHRGEKKVVNFRDTPVRPFQAGTGIARKRNDAHPTQQCTVPRRGREQPALQRSPPSQRRGSLERHPDHKHPLADCDRAENRLPRRHPPNRHRALDSQHDQSSQKSVRSLHAQEHHQTPQGPGGASINSPTTNVISKATQGVSSGIGNNAAPPRTHTTHSWVRTGSDSLEGSSRTHAVAQCTGDGEATQARSSAGRSRFAVAHRPHQANLSTGNHGSAADIEKNTVTASPRVDDDGLDKSMPLLSGCTNDVFDLDETFGMGAISTIKRMILPQMHSRIEPTFDQWASASTMN